MEEEMARIAAEKEAIESKYKSIEKQMKLLQHDFVCNIVYRLLYLLTGGAG